MKVSFENQGWYACRAVDPIQDEYWNENCTVWVSIVNNATLMVLQQSKKLEQVKSPLTVNGGNDDLTHCTHTVTHTVL